MDELTKKIISIYLGISISDALIKITKLNTIYFKSKKASTQLKYKKGLMSSSKEDLRIPRIMHLSAIINLCKHSFNPANAFETTKNMFFNEDEFISGYVDLFNYTYEVININEEMERTEVAKFLADIYREYEEYLPDSYMGNKLEDESIRISRKEMIKFLKKHKIILEELPTEDPEYADYNVMLLNSAKKLIK